MFNPQQQHFLLTRMGYKGPVNQDLMNKFLASNPDVASRVGRMASTVIKYEPQIKKFAEGGTLLKTPKVVQAPEPMEAPIESLQEPTLQNPAGVSQDSVAKPPQGLDEVSQYYTDYLGRDPTEEDLTAIQENLSAGTPLDTFMSQIKGSPEADARTKSLEAAQAYKDYLGRDPNEQELANLKDNLFKGGNLEDITLGIATSPEAQAYRESNYGKKDYTWTAADVSGLKMDINAQVEKLSDLTNQLNDNPNDPNIKAIHEQETLRLADLQKNLAQAEVARGSMVPTGTEVINTGLEDPTSLSTPTDPVTVSTGTNQQIAQGTGTVGTTGTPEISTASDSTPVPEPVGFTAANYDPTSVYQTAVEITDAIDPVTGAVTKDIDPASLDPNLLAQLGVDPAKIEEAVRIGDFGTLELTPDMLAKAATMASYPSSQAATTDWAQVIDPTEFSSPTPEATASTDYDLGATQTGTLNPTEVVDAEVTDPVTGVPQIDTPQVTDRISIQDVVGTVNENMTVASGSINVNPEVVAQAVEAVAATSEKLSTEATMIAASGSFSQNSLAKAAQGIVPVAHTVQGQLKGLMDQFNDGTPAWAAGAVRNANSLMASRGLGGSSMAGAAILQAAMESALPIAMADATIYETMRRDNLSNRQAVALSNAAAQQGIELANLSNAQQAALTNSNRGFTLQQQNLSNQQQVVLANQAVKQAMVEKSLDINTSVSLSNAAMYAEVNSINLNNAQQTSLAEAANNLQIDLANLSASESSALARFQVQGALLGQNLSNRQQMAVIESTQNYDSAKFNATSETQAFMQDAMAQAALQGQVLSNKQQTALFNVGNQMTERGVEFDAKQQAKMFNTTNLMNVDLAKMSNRQQTALANAQIDAALKGQELSNKQQVNILNAERVAEIAGVNFTAQERTALAQAEITNSVDLANLSTANAKVLSDAVAMTSMDMANLNNRQTSQVENARNFLQMDLTNTSNAQQTMVFKNQSVLNSLLSDQAAANASEQFNAASENQVNTFFSELSANIGKFNTEQSNLINTFNAGETNGAERFYAEMRSMETRFNASNALLIAQANTKWNQDVATINTANQQESNRADAMAANGYTLEAMQQLYQKERDKMAFAFQYSESALDRDFQLFMADKNISAASSAANKEALGYLFGKIAFGSGGDSQGLLGGLLG